MNTLQQGEQNLGERTEVRRSCWQTASPEKLVQGLPAVRIPSEQVERAYEGEAGQLSDRAHNIAARRW